MPKSLDSTLRQMTPLSEDELNELGAFLLSDSVSDEAMILDILDGYLVAIAIGPTSLRPSDWLPGVWGRNRDDAPAFESMEEAKLIVDLILRHFNSIIESLEQDPDRFEPLFGTFTSLDSPGEWIDGDGWASGFLQGIALCQQDWQPLFDDEQGQQWLRPMTLIGADEITAELSRRPDLRAEHAKQIPASVAAIYRYWLPYRQAVHERLLAATMRRSAPKVGRNDPCPCGSGKKFKKCCGAAENVH